MFLEDGVKEVSYILKANIVKMRTWRLENGAVLGMIGTVWYEADQRQFFKNAKILMAEIYKL
jgi:hypothetical protein